MATAGETHRQLLVVTVGCPMYRGGPIGQMKYGHQPNWFEPTRDSCWADEVRCAAAGATEAP